jgi:hypothetical protein
MVESHIYDDIETEAAKMGGKKLPFLSDGTYDVEVLTASEGKSGKDKKPYFRSTVKILSSSGDTALTAGREAVLVFKQDGYNYYLRDIANFVAAVADTAPNAVNGAAVKELLDAEQPLGVKIRIQVSTNQNGNQKYKFFAA